MIPRQPPGYTPVVAEVKSRFVGFFGTKLNRLGPSLKWRNFRLLNYALGSTLVTLSVLNILYDLNISAAAILRMPLVEFFRQQVVPFLAHPFTLVGIQLNQIFGSILGISLVGGSLWANAEYRTGSYLHLYVFPSQQRRPGSIEFKDFGVPPPPPPSPPEFVSIRSASRVPHALVLGYSLLGLFPAVAGVLGGMTAISRYAWEVWLLALSLLAFLSQRFLVRFERPADQDYFGTRLFLLMYRRHRNVDDRLAAHLKRRNLIHATPLGPLRALLSAIMAEASRVAALAIFILAMLFLLVQFGALGDRRNYLSSDVAAARWETVICHIQTRNLHIKANRSGSATSIYFDIRRTNVLLSLTARIRHPQSDSHQQRRWKSNSAICLQGVA